MLSFWKPGTVGPGSTLDRATEAEAEGNLVISSSISSQSLQYQRERLPIFKHSMRFLVSLELDSPTSPQDKSCFIA
jgi:ATP-dependent RNA helicase DDX35